MRQIFREMTMQSFDGAKAFFHHNGRGITLPVAVANERIYSNSIPPGLHMAEVRSEDATDLSRQNLLDCASVVGLENDEEFVELLEECIDSDPWLIVEYIEGHGGLVTESIETVNENIFVNYEMTILMPISLDEVRGMLGIPEVEEFEVNLEYGEKENVNVTMRKLRDYLG